jgi:hypothetical protein
MESELLSALPFEATRHRIGITTVGAPISESAGRCDRRCTHAPNRSSALRRPWRSGAHLSCPTLRKPRSWFDSKPLNHSSGVAQICNLPCRGVALRWVLASSKAPGTDQALAEYNSAIQQFTKLRYKYGRTQPFKVVRTRRSVPFAHLVVTLVLLLIPCISLAVTPCEIQVVEKSSGWPVPLVELRTTHNVRLVTDNAGVIALDLPEVMGRETWFDVIGHGYEIPKDGFGYRGVRLVPQPGKTLRIEVTRTILARRVGRLTGAGLFAESQKLGRELDWPESGVFGCDSVQNAVHRGKLFWAWGDTTMPHYPLGIFDMSSATTAVQPLDSFQPPLRLKLNYFTDANGKPRAVARMPGSGPTWVSGYVSLPDKTGTPRLVGAYVKIRPPMDAYETGLCVWNDTTANFEQLRILWTKSDSAPKPPVYPDGQPLMWTDSDQRLWVLFGNPLPVLRCPATFEAWQDPTRWEVLKPQETVPAAGEGKPVKPHSGSIAWNGFRQRYVTVFMEAFGHPSAFGELWYAEAKEPTGPWGPALKILSHDNYTFYNPRLHSEFTPVNSPILIFEGTYTMQFANKPQPTPRYDYNQIVYRLDLDDPALAAANR